MNHEAKTNAELLRDMQILRQRIAELDAIVAAHQRTEDTLRLQANLLDAVEQAVIVTNLDGSIIHWNRFAERLYGWSAAEVVGRNILDVTAIATTHAQAVELMARLRHGEHWSGEFLVRRRDGTTFIAEVSDTPVYDADGRLIGIVGLSSDITERKRTERRRTVQYAVSQVLAESATLADAASGILQAIGEGLEWDYGALWKVDQRDNLLVCVSTWHTPVRAFAAFEAITRQRTFVPGVGLPGRVWIGREPLWIADAVIDSNFPRAPFARAAGLHAAFGFPIRFDHDILGVIEFFSHAIQAPDPDLLHLVTALGTQIGQFMERKQVEAALRESEARTRAIVEAALDCIITIDHTGRVIEFNPAAEQTFGYQRDAILGRELADLIIPPHLRSQHHQGLAHYLATGEGPVLGKRIELPAVRADGSEFPVELAITRIPTDGPPLFTGFLRDITERKQAEDERSALLAREQAARAEAQEAVGLRDVFLSVASHELKTPLTSLMGQAQLLQRRGQPDGAWHERDRHSIRVITEQARRLNKMILALLDVSRLETGQLSIEHAPLDLGVLARRVIAEVQPTLEKHTVIYSGPDVPLVIAGDELRLEQVLQNLVQNAVKYSPRGGQVGVHVTQRGRTACVAVTDEGMGIPQEAVPRLFGRYYRAGNVEAQHIAGMGIGLFVVKEIVTMHGGTVEVESAEGLGSTFTVCLPVLEHPVADPRCSIRKK